MGAVAVQSGASLTPPVLARTTQQYTNVTNTHSKFLEVFWDLCENRLDNRQQKSYHPCPNGGAPFEGRVTSLAPSVRD